MASSPIKVLLMASSLRGGGSEQQTSLLLRHLDRTQFAPQLYLTHRVGDLLKTIPSDVVVHSPPEDGPMGVAGRVLDRIPGTRLRRQAQWFADCVRRERVDVIYDRTFHMTMIAGHPSRKHNVPRVSTIVSPPHVALPLVEPRFTSWKRRRLADAYAKSHAVIAVSGAAADSAASYYGLPRDQIQVIPNPVDRDAIMGIAGVEASPSASGQSVEGQSHAASTGTKLSSEHLTLVCVGRMTREKGQSDLLDAIGRLPGRWPRGCSKLVVRFIGDGPLRGELEAKWRAMADASGTVDGHQVEFAGSRFPAIPEMVRSDGLVLSSHFEGMPNVVLESFVLGIPVIATRSGGTQELQVGNNQPTCFWANPQDPESLAQALIEFASSAAERAKRVQTAQELVTNRHTIAHAVDKISQHLRAAAGR